MLADVVIDTNVFVHADDKRQTRRNDSRSVMHALLGCGTQLCVDPGFSTVPSKNRSLIGHEYIKHIRAPMLGYAVLTALGVAGRIVAKPNTLRSKEQRQARQRLLPANAGDRRFLTVAANSAERILVSHDYTDFTKTTRKEIKRIFDVSVVEAVDCHPKLRD